MAEWTEAPLLSPVAHGGWFLMSQLVLAGLEPTILWLGVRCANHSVIATRHIVNKVTFEFEKKKKTCAIQGSSK